MKVLRGNIVLPKKDHVANCIVNIKYIDYHLCPTNEHGHKVVTFDYKDFPNGTSYVAPYSIECEGEYQWINYVHLMNSKGIKVVGVMGKNFLPIASLFCNELIVVDENIYRSLSKSKNDTKDLEIYNPEYLKKSRPSRFPKARPDELVTWMLNRPITIDSNTKLLFDNIKNDYVNTIFVLFRQGRYESVVNQIPKDPRVIIDYKFKVTTDITKKMDGNLLAYQILSSIECGNQFIGFGGVSNLFIVSPVNSISLCDYTTTTQGPVIKNITNVKYFGTGTKFLHHSIDRSVRRFYPIGTEMMENINYINSYINQKRTNT